MRRTSKTLAKKGSQKWIQKVVNSNPDILDAKIKKQLGMPDAETIAWLSPLASDEYAGYQDQSFLDLLDIETRIAYHARCRHVHVVSSFPLRHHYRAMLGLQC